MKKAGRPLLALALILGLTVLILNLLGRTWWCKCGSLAPWSWQIWSLHNSQHLLDPYTFSHLQHGLLFYGLLLLLLHRWRRSSRFILAMAIESSWEIFENTPMIIQRYREATISLDYFGDAILNSLSDILACAAGFGLAACLPAWSSVLLFAVVESAMLITIRDSLIINVLMLIAPLDAVKNWQMGGGQTP